MLSKPWFFCLIYFTLFACGESGSSDRPLPPTQQELAVDEEESPSFQFTQLPSHFFSYQAPDGFPCLSQSVGSTLAHEPGFPLDKQIVKKGSYMQSAALLAASPERSLHLWIAADHLHFLARIPAKEPLALEMDWFGLVRSAQKLRVELRKQLQLSELGAFSFDEGQVSSSSLGKFTRVDLENSQVYHFEIPLQKFGDVLFWPNLLLRVRNVNHSLEIATRTYEGILSASDGGMTVSQCDDWRQHPGELMSHGLIGKSDGISDRGTQALNIAREAIAEGVKLFGGFAPKRSIPLVISDEPMETKPKQEAGSLGVGLQSDRLSSLYTRDDGKLSVYVQALLGFWLHQFYGVWLPGTSYQLTQQSLSLALSFVQIEQNFGRIQSLIWYQHFAREQNLQPAAVLYGWALAQLPIETLRQDLQELTSIKAAAPPPDQSLQELLGRRFPRLSGLPMLKDAQYLPLKGAEILADSDQDGLSDLMEAVTDSLIHEVDSDGDSWGDYSEYLAATDMRSALIKASTLIQDGSLGDWFELIPNKIAKKEIQAGECPSRAQIGWYGAVAEERRVLFAGNNLTGSDSGRLIWVVKVLVPEHQNTFSLRADSLSPQVVMTAKIGKGADAQAQEQIKHSFQGRVLGSDGFEMAFDARAFGLENINFAKPGLATVQIQLMEMVDGKEVLCDTTNEFFPVSTVP